MHKQHTRTEAQVARLFGISHATLARMRLKGAIHADGRHKPPSMTHFYEPATVDAFLSRNAKNLHVAPPTLQALEADNALLTIDHLMVRLGLSESAVRSMVDQGILGRINIRGNIVRVPSSEVAYYEWRTSPECVLDIEEAATLLSVSVHEMHAILGEYKEILEIDDLRGRDGRVHILRASFNALLGQFLHGIAVEEWYKLTLHDRVALVSAPTAGAQLGTSPHVIKQYIAAGLPALRIGQQGHWRIPEPALRRLPKQGERYTAQRIAEIFTVPEWMAQQWLREKLFCQRQHDSEDRECPSYECVLAFVTRNLRWGAATPTAWLRARHINAAALVELHDMPIWGATQEVVNTALHEGVLQGIWLPNSSGEPSLHVTPQSLRTFIWRRDQVYLAQALRSNLELAA